MGTQTKYPNKAERVEVRRLFKEKIADPIGIPGKAIKQSQGMLAVGLLILWLESSSMDRTFDKEESWVFVLQRTSRRLLLSDH